jgi:hypothetical protein
MAEVFMAPTRALAVAVLAAFGLPALAAAQGLGDAANKEKKRRSSHTSPPAKTYTQDDLASLPPAANEEASEETDKTVSSEPTPKGAEGASGTVRLPPAETRPDEGAARASEERVWRARVERARAQVEEAQKVYEKLAGMNLVPGYEYVDDKGRTVVRTIEELQSLTAAAKKRLDAAQAALDQLLEQARRAGVPPGWLR